MIRIRWPLWRRLTTEEHVIEAVHLLTKIATPPEGRRKDGSFCFAHLNTTPEMPFTLHFTYGPMAAEIIERENQGYDGPEHG